ncbi:hypothetical protein Pelo_15823 [Pelomyxa schiedti]|nr:hypothetical protein Pelo_15823 [Pelomyxa schiedti]
MMGSQHGPATMHNSQIRSPTGPPPPSMVLSQQHALGGPAIAPASAAPPPSSATSPPSVQAQMPPTMGAGPIQPPVSPISVVHPLVPPPNEGYFPLPPPSPTDPPRFASIEHLLAPFFPQDLLDPTTNHVLRDPVVTGSGKYSLATLQQRKVDPVTGRPLPQTLTVVAQLQVEIDNRMDDLLQIFISTADTEMPSSLPNILRLAELVRDRQTSPACVKLCRSIINLLVRHSSFLSLGSWPAGYILSIIQIASHPTVAEVGFVHWILSACGENSRIIHMLSPAQVSNLLSLEWYATTREKRLLMSGTMLAMFPEKQQDIVRLIACKSRAAAIALARAHPNQQDRTFLCSTLGEQVPGPLFAVCPLCEVTLNPNAWQSHMEAH